MSDESPNLNPSGSTQPPAAPDMAPPMYSPAGYQPTTDVQPAGGTSMLRRVIILTVGVLVVLAVGAAAITFGKLGAPGPNLLQRASDTCNTGTLSDNNKTLLFDMAGEDHGSGTGSIADYKCLMTALDVPQAAQAKMGETRALDGRQSDSWKTDDGATMDASWSYHPDNGLDIIFELDS